MIAGGDNALSAKMTNDSENPDPLFDARAAAAYLGLVGVVKHPAQAVWALCRKRRLRSTRVAGKVMIRKCWLEAYIRQSEREPYCPG